MRVERAAIVIVFVAGCLPPTPVAELNVSERPADAATLQRAPAAPALERASHPDEAFRWRRRRWVNEHGVIPEGALRNAVSQRLAVLN
ncbi:MAG: hypothetical protein V3T70_04075, partial [Phycisphaerae bacterium]